MPTRTTTRAAPALAAASGMLYFLAFPPVDCGIIAFVALVPLLLALRGQRRGRAFLLGWLAGSIGIYALVATSILEAALRFLPEHRWLAYALALGIPQIYGALYFGVFAVCVRDIQSRRFGAVTQLLSVAAAWTACEFVRSRLGDGCPWVLLAHSQHLRPWIIQIADVGGAPAVTFVVAMVNAAFAMQVAGRHASIPMLARLRAAGVTLVCLAVVRVYGERQLTYWATPPGGAVRVALVQGNIPEEWRSSLRRLPDALTRLRGLTAQAMSGAPDLVVWPENAVTVSVADNDQLFSGLAGQLPAGGRLVVGAPRAERDSSGRTWLRNSAYLLDESGRPIDVYDKLRLTPYGETLPFAVRMFVGALRPEDPYTTGTRVTVFDVAGHRFATVICYEAIYAPLVRPFVRAGAEFLVNISNDGWFGAQPSLDQHFNAVLFRAVETRRSLLRATNAGITAVIDPRGIVAAEAPRAQATLLVATITANAEQSVYTRVGDVCGWLCLLTAAGVWVSAVLPRSSGYALLPPSWHNLEKGW